MSVDAVEKFFRKLDEDEEVRGELHRALKGKADQAPTVVEMGAQHGFTFSGEEYQEVVDSLSNEELSEDDLDNVAGGVRGSFQPINIKVQDGALVEERLIGIGQGFKTV